MREIFSFFFEQLTDPLSLPLSPLADWLILAILHELVYIQAFRMVGDLYHSGFINGRFAGSLLHWSFRGISFLVAWVGVTALIFICRFVTKHWLMIIGIIGSILLAVGTGFVYRLIAKRQRVKSASH